MQNPYQPPAQGYAPPGYAPPVMQGQVQVNMGGYNSGLSALARLKGVYVKQKLDMIEVLGLCEKSNTYWIFETDDQGTKPDFKRTAPIFKCREKSSCWQRNCLPGDCRAFEMNMKQYDQMQETHTVIRFSREYKLTCLCCARPTLEVYTEQGTKIGSVFYPFMCCDKGVIINDLNEQCIYEVKGSCCQWPFLVNLPCETCQKATFNVIDPMGTAVSQIVKESAGFCSSLCADNTNFRVLFPTGATPEQKALLVAATIFMDYNYFENNPNDQNNNQGY